MYLLTVADPATGQLIASKCKWFPDLASARLAASQATDFLARSVIDASNPAYKPPPKQFVVFTCPPGVPPDPDAPGVKLVGQYGVLANAHVAADQAAATAIAHVYDGDNDAVIYSNGPGVADLLARGVDLGPWTSRMDRATYLRWERRQIEVEVRAKLGCVGWGGMDDFAAIMKMATCSPRRSGQTPASCLADYR